MNFLLIFLSIVIFGIIPLVFIIKILWYMYPYFFWGGIDVPTTEEKIEKMVKFLEINPGQSAIDLGAGEGRILIALARAGAVAYGCEVNPLLVAKARKNIKKAGLEGRAFVYCKNFWRQDLKDFDAVAVFPMAHMMRRLEEKFEKELRPGAKVVSNYFMLPTWKPDRAEDNVYLYIKR